MRKSKELRNGIKTVLSFLKKSEKRKKSLYRITMSIITCLMIVTDITIPIHASTAVRVVETLPYTYSVRKSDGSWADNGVDFGVIEADGEIAFCVDPTVMVNSNASYTKENYTISQKRTMEHIAYAGYHMSNKTGEDYVATQFMIWEALGWTITATSFTAYSTYRERIQKRMEIFNDFPSFSGIHLSIKVGESITLNDTNGVFKEYWLTSASEGISVSHNGNNLTITASAAAPENAEVKYQLVKKECVGTSILYVSPNSQDVVPFKVPDPLEIKINIEVQKYGKVRIVKHDAVTGKVVKKAGIVYDIYKTSDDSYVSTVTSDSSGVAESGLLEANDYYYIEQIAPTDYLINSEKHYFTVTPESDDQEFVSLTATDTPVKGKSTIKKEDPISGTRPQGDAKLDSAIYGLYADENIMDPSNDGTILYKKDQEVARRTIVNNTATVEDLPLGAYYWKEIEAPVGYNLDPDKHPVNLRYKDQSTAIVQADTVSKDTVKEQAFQIIKLETPGHGEAPTLGGAGFVYILKRYVEEYGLEEAIEIAKLNDGRILPSEWGYMETDDDGYAISKLLPYGKYVVHESVVPKDHYPVDDFEVTINEHSPDQPQKFRFLIDETLETKLMIVKKDSETGNSVPISGMKFKVKCLTKTADFNAGDYVSYKSWWPVYHVVDEWETTEDGSVMLEMSLKAGTYQIEEVDAKAPYLLNQEPLIFTITEGWSQIVGPDDETLITVVEFANTSVKGQAKIDKQGELFKGYESTMTEYGELFTPVYERGMLPNVKFVLKAETDIVGADGTVWYTAGELIETLITDGENITVSSLLPLGSEDHNLYSLREVETEEGYALDDTVYYFRFDYVDQNTPVVSPTWVDPDGKPLVFDGIVHNEKQKAVAVINKEIETSEIEDNRNAYKDIVFGCFSDVVEGLEGDSLVGIAKVNEDHTVNFDLSQEGSYYLAELSTNDKLILDKEIYPFAFTYNGDQIQTIMINEGKPIVNYLKRATIEIIKYTEDDLYYSKAEQTKLAELGDMSEYMRTDLLEDERKYIAFVEFELSTDKEFKNIIRTGETDIDGRLVFEDLELGTFYIREKKSADFYEINDETFEVTLDRHCQFETVEVNDDLITSYVDVKKVDYYDHSKVLPFAGFTMYSDPECTKALETKTAGIDGIVRFEGITFGSTVYIKETSAPIGYDLSDEIIEVVIDEDWITGGKDTRIIIYPDRPFPSSGGPNTGNSATALPYSIMLLLSAGVLIKLKKRYER